MRLIDADKMRENLVWCKSQSSSYDNYWDDVIERLDAQPTVNDWVSVKDRLPEFEGDYLVTDGHRVPWKCRMIKLGEIKGWVNSASNPVVKYWMPLPELPKEDDNAES